MFKNRPLFLKNSYEDLEENRDKIKKLYEESVKKNGELASESYLFIKREGFEKELENFSKQIISDGKSILDKIEHLIKNGRFLEKKEKNKKRIDGLIYKIRSFIITPNLILYDNQFGNDQLIVVKRWIKELSELSGEHLDTNLHQIKEYVDSVFEFQKLHNFLFDLNMFIAHNLSTSYIGLHSNNIRLNFDIEEEEETEQNKKERIGGRETPPELIEDLKKILLEIRDVKRFRNKEGKLKPTTIAGYALDQKWFSEKWKYTDKHIYNLLLNLI